MDSDKAKQTGNFILILIAMVLGVLIGLMFASTGARQQEGTLEGKVSEVMKLVEDEYVDKVDADSVSERIVAAILSELDPHSTYLSARESERTDEMMRGNFEGVGIILHYENDSVYVGQLVADGPSSKVGLLPGDLIMTVDNDTVSGVGMDRDSVVARLRGPRATMVEVHVKRLGKEHSYKIRRGVVNHQTVSCAKMLNDTTGYILLASFSSTSYEEFTQALSALKRKGMKKLIFDLRGNGGGSLSSAVGIAGELLPAGSLIVYTQGAHSRRRDVKAPRGGLFTKGTVVVMVDENSASASEVVSGALQDNDRATIVGRRTFGKGLVQTDFSLNDGAAVLLTTARYYTPSGRSIQRPYSDGTDEYYRSYLTQLIDESYADSITVHIADSTPYYTRGGRVVYGGGGIVPDRLLPYHKDESLVYYNKLASKGLINRVAFRHVRQHAAELLRRYPDARTFDKGFRTSETLLSELVAEGERNGVAKNDKSIAAQHPLMAAMLKAYIGLALYGNDAFYDAYLPMDDDLKETITMKL